MYLRHSVRRKDGKTHTYWRLVRSVRRNGKVFQETVAQLGELDAQGRANARALARRITGRADQREMFEDLSENETSVTVRLNRVRLETKIEQHLVRRLGELFSLDYDLLLYDVTSTYFEGLAERKTLASRGYSRDHRRDCKQVCIALVVTREGMPLGYEVFAGNRVDVTTVEEIVGTMEAR